MNFVVPVEEWCEGKWKMIHDTITEEDVAANPLCGPVGKPYVRRPTVGDQLDGGVFVQSVAWFGLDENGTGPTHVRVEVEARPVEQPGTSFLATSGHPLFGVVE